MLAILGRRRTCLPDSEKEVENLPCRSSMFSCAALQPAAQTPLIYWKLKWHLCFPLFLRLDVQKSRGISIGVSLHTTCSLLLKDCLRGWGCSWLKSTLEAVPCRGALPDPVLLPPPLYRHLSLHSQAASQIGGASSQGNQSIWKLTHDPLFSAGSAHRSS